MVASRQARCGVLRCSAAGSVAPTVACSQAQARRPGWWGTERAVKGNNVPSGKGVWLQAGGGVAGSRQAARAWVAGKGWCGVGRNSRAMGKPAAGGNQRVRAREGKPTAATEPKVTAAQGAVTAVTAGGKAAGGANGKPRKAVVAIVGTAYVRG